MAITQLNGQIGLQSSRQSLVAAGKMYTVTTTANTPIAYALKTGFSATANGLWSIANNNTIASGINIQLDRLKLIETATAATGTLIMRGEVYTETSIVAIGTAAATITPINLNPSFSNSSQGTVTFFNAGAGTVPAAVGSRRLVGVVSLATGVAVQYDSYTFEFGADGQSSGTVGLTAARATDPADLVTWGPPVTIAPQTSAYMNLWWVTAAANIPSFEFQLTYSEL